MTAPSAVAFLAVTPCVCIGNTVTKIIYQGLRLLQKSSLLCYVLCILHSTKSSVWDLFQRWDPAPQKTKPVLAYPERRILASGPSPHRSNVTNLGLLLTIPDERGTIFGHDVPFFLQHTNSEQHRGNGHKDNTCVYYTPAGTYLIIENEILILCVYIYIYIYIYTGSAKKIYTHFNERKLYVV